jgi:hypothetical protein
VKIESKKTILEFDKNSRESFELLARKLRDNDLNPANVDLFVYAMTYGFLNGNKVDSVQRSGTGPRVQYLKPEHEILMYAIQFAETGSTESLLNQEERFDLAERYAEGGIRLLKNAAEQPGDLVQDLTGQMALMFSQFTTEAQTA